MKHRMWLAGVLAGLLWTAPAKADTGVIVRTTAGLPALQLFCSLPTTCTVVGGALDGPLGLVFSLPCNHTTATADLSGSLAWWLDGVCGC